MAIRVFNLHEDHWEGKGVYIGRPGILGNPFALGRDGKTTKEVIQLYRRWLAEIALAGKAGQFNGREPVLEKYRHKADQAKHTEEEFKQAVWEALTELLDRVARGEDLNLLCHCRPHPCHGDVLKACLEWLQASLHAH